MTLVKGGGSSTSMVTVFGRNAFQRIVRFYLQPDLSIFPYEEL